MLTLWPGSYQDREEPFNFDWNAAIEVRPPSNYSAKRFACLRLCCLTTSRHLQVNEGTNVVLQHNIVAGFERVAYRIDGEPCPGTMVDVSTSHSFFDRLSF